MVMVPGKLGYDSSALSYKVGPDLYGFMFLESLKQKFKSQAPCNVRVSQQFSLHLDIFRWDLCVGMCGYALGYRSTGPMQRRF